jgi:hypothetical protein
MVIEPIVASTPTVSTVFQRRQLLDVVPSAQFLDRRAVRRTPVAEDLQELLEVPNNSSLRVCTWAPTPKPGGTITSKADAVRECEPVTLKVTCWAGARTTRPCPAAPEALR